VSRELTSILDRQELLQRVADSVRKIVDYERLQRHALERADPAAGDCFHHALQGIDSRTASPPSPSRPHGHCRGERRVLRIHDVTEDSRYIRCDTGVAARSELVVPLLMQDRLIGVLDLESTEPHAFTLEHERMLSTLGSYIAIALENARLYEEARERERRLRDDLDTPGKSSSNYADWRAGNAGSRSRGRLRSGARTGRRFL